VVPFRGVVGNGRVTPFTITFDLPQVPKGKAMLRLSICAASTKSIDVSVNGQPAGKIDKFSGGDSTITRHNMRGIWYEREFPVDASMLREGTNTLTLAVPAGPINNGVIYDYLRLELDDGTATAVR